MLQELKNELNRTHTENGAATLRTTGSDCLDLFATIGAIRNADEAEVDLRFMRAYAENPLYAMKILFFARDIRGGLGERRVFRIISKWLAHNHPDSIIKNLPLIAEFGRFDDMLELLDTPCEQETINCLKEQFLKDMEKLEDINASVSLLGKWLPSVNASNSDTVRKAKKLAKAFGMQEREYRKALSALRERIAIIENNLRKKEYWFNYEAVPSRAMLKYKKAFMRNDEARYTDYLERVASGECKMNTAAIEPYEIVTEIIGKCADYYGRFVNHLTPEEKLSLNTTWNALVDYTNDENALVVKDGSGSMFTDTRPVPAAVALSLAMYFAERNKGAFANHFITFSENPQLVEIKGKDIVDKVEYCMGFDEVANTNIEKVFRLILNTAVKNHLPQEELPSRIYIVSDMEFDRCAEGADITNFEAARRMYEQAGYQLPQVIFWNVESRNTQQPVAMNESGVALVSGCTPRLFQLMLRGEISPYAQMLEIINSARYALVEA